MLKRLETGLRKYLRAGLVALLLATIGSAALAATGCLETAAAPLPGALGRSAPLSWSAGPALPAPRSRAVAVTNGASIFLIGGSTTGNPRAAYRLGLGATSWVPAPDLDRDRVGLGGGTTGSERIIVFGGLEEIVLNSTLEYNPTGAIVPFADHQDLANMSDARWLHAYTSDSIGRQYAIGGLNNAGRLLDSVERYYHSTNAWTTLASLPEGRYAFAAASDGNGHIFTFGGGTENSPTSVSKRVYRYSITRNTWSPAAEMPVATRESAAALGSDGRIYVVGGASESGPLSRVLVYDPVADSWGDETPLPAAVRAASLIVDAEGRLVVIGGVDAGNNEVASIWMSQSLTASDTAPAITSTPITTATVGAPYSYQVTATGNPPPSFSLVSYPTGMVIDSATGLMSWTPAAGQDGPQGVTVRASNYVGNADQTFTITVSAEPPDTQVPSVPTGLVATDVQQTTVALAWNAASDNMGVAGYRLYEFVTVNPFSSHWVLRLDGIAGTSMTVTGLDPGSTHKYAVTAFDAAGNESARSATLEITNLQPPTAYHPTSGSNEPVYAIVGQLFTYDVDATGVPAPTFSLASGPAGMTVGPDSGLVQWTPQAGDEGTATATVRATNSEGFDDHTFSFPIYPEGTDLEPPTPVFNVAATNITTNGATLSWDPATDNVGVAGYLTMAQKDGRGNPVFAAGDSVGPGTTFEVTSLEPATGYRLWVAAYDAAGNVATISGTPGVHITTLQPPPTLAADLYLSLVLKRGTFEAGPLAGVGGEDILRFDGAGFAMFFDGSDMGLGSLDLDAFHIVDSDTILMSFTTPANIPGLLSRVDDSDIIQFDATSLGENTAGTFSLFLDGSAVGLTTSGEDIDAMELLPDGRLLISTRGTARLAGIRSRKEDLLSFTPDSAGDYSRGTWAMYFDGSDVGEVGNIDGVAVADDGDVYLTTMGDFTLTGVSGKKEDVIVCTPTRLGTVTACNYPPVLYFDGSAFGLSDNDVDAIDLH